MQRTRSSPSAPRSPLTRCPLGHAIGLAALLLLGAAPKSKPVLTSAELEDIRETVYRWELQRCPTGDVGGDNVFFFGLEGRQDPSSQLLERFAGSQLPVKPLSASVIGGDFVLRDRATGLQGSLYWIGQIRPLSASMVEVGASCCSLMSVLRLTRDKGKWRVLSSRADGVA